MSDSQLRQLQDNREALLTSAPSFAPEDQRLLPRLDYFESTYQRARVAQSAYAAGLEWALGTASLLLLAFASYAHVRQVPAVSAARNILLPTVSGIFFWLETEKMANKIAYNYRHERFLRGQDYAREERQARINPYELL